MWASNAAIATGGVNNSASGVCTHPWSAACVMKPAIILPQWLLAVSVPVAITLLFFGGADNGANNTAAVATGGIL
jgi:hypothetical protein